MKNRPALISSVMIFIGVFSATTRADVRGQVVQKGKTQLPVVTTSSIPIPPSRPVTTSTYIFVTTSTLPPTGPVIPTAPAYSSYYFERIGKIVSVEGYLIIEEQNGNMIRIPTTPQKDLVAQCHQQALAVMNSSDRKLEIVVQLHHCPPGMFCAETTNEVLVSCTIK
jgi:hypothetical protein